MEHVFEFLLEFFLEIFSDWMTKKKPGDGSKEMERKRRVLKRAVYVVMLIIGTFIIVTLFIGVQYVLSLLFPELFDQPFALIAALA